MVKKDATKNKNLTPKPNYEQMEELTTAETIVAVLLMVGAAVVFIVMLLIIAGVI